MTTIKVRWIHQIALLANKLWNQFRQVWTSFSMSFSYRPLSRRHCLWVNRVTIIGCLLSLLKFINCKKKKFINSHTLFAETFREALSRSVAIFDCVDDFVLLLTAMSHCKKSFLLLCMIVILLCGNGCDCEKFDDEDIVVIHTKYGRIVKITQMDPKEGGNILFVDEYMKERWLWHICKSTL